jgi:hypothetical protein
MFTNNTKIASFYPTSKRPNNSNYFNQLSNTSLTTTSNKNNNLTFLNNGEAINFQDKTISPSIELALITINLSNGRFKSMSREELDNYVKTMAYNNSYDSRKYLLAFNILNAEIDKIHNHIIIQQPSLNKNTIEKSKLEKNMSNNRINMNEMICIEPDEFKLNTFSNGEKSDYTSMTSNSNYYLNSQSVPMKSNHSIINQNFDSKLASKQNKNMDMSTYNGNPMGLFRITNNNPGNSVRPINPIIKQDFDNTSCLTNINHQDNTSSVNNIYNQSQNLTQYSKQAINHNNIIQQSSIITNGNNFQTNGGRRRTSNLDVGNSNNYVIIK